MKEKIDSYILGKDLKNLGNFLGNKKYVGTYIGHENGI
jgi:hypothetical protein